MEIFDGGSGGGRKIKFNKKFNWIGYLVLALILVIIAGVLSLGLITDYIWMDSLDYAGVFTTILSSKILLAVAGFILFAAGTFFTLYWIRRSYMKHFDPNQLPPILLRRKAIIFIMIGISAIIGLFGSSVIQGIGWERTLKFLNHVSFGQTDPYFDMDISFYVYVLPFLKFIVFVLIGLSVFFLLLEIGAYSVFQMYRLSRSAQMHLGTTLGVIGLLLAANHVLQPFDTLSTNQVNLFQQSVVTGLSYTDDLINVPKAYILAAVAIIMTIWMIVALVRGRLRSVVVPIAVYVGLAIIGQGASVVVQNFIVSPNEFSKEKPYLEDDLSYTKAAYDLDSIEERQHPGNKSLTQEMVERNSGTIDNVRMNDSRPLLDVYNQLQTFRTYYEFNDVDIDRYKIDGNYEQVFLGARELNTTDLPSQAKTWVNQNLRYTHGYGLAMSHVNQVTPQGQPEYMLKNLPPEGSMDVERPQIYFGEEPYKNVIVNSKVEEFDYPSGDENVDTRFKANTGISLSGINRLLFALNEGSFRMLISDQVTSDSQLLDTRNIMDRVNRIAPFFTYDQDPYLVVRDDGSTVWMLDAYLTAESYPYSEAFQGETNYIRNSVKVSIDAYTGEVNFYIAEPDDPLMQTFRNIFPDLFTEDIPEDIKAHFRYPEKLFTVQASMYGTYHMSDLEVFYNREDFWQFPTEKYFNEDTTMEPYYTTLKLPNQDEEEFILMIPYTPKNRQNMIAWMGVRNDGDNYGDIFVYRFPKQRNIYGPQQIENRINQDSEISQELNLWSQGGSEVIRGNLLAIPIEDTVLYVEPIYIESNNETSLPEVKRVVLAYGDQIVMEANFDKALEEMLKTVDPKAEDEGEQGDQEDDKPDSSQPIIGAEEQLQEFSDLFKDYKQALSSGDWQKAAEIMDELEGMLDNETKVPAPDNPEPSNDKGKNSNATESSSDQKTAKDKE
ncbi:UPF0182 family membrane protein [Lentibacillus cibarius]|uniref:UPF0182 protein FFL34_10225 n=1 Tax=Lentibacillus cibarius TaxID=2583219 RepID=A0A5S3QL31_9BACI|nr:UPF0182 family protein [Lentibacillus cibarius]TMN22447.1 UPF0182 family protein [Lentibacillus cibarius]